MVRDALRRAALLTMRPGDLRRFADSPEERQRPLNDAGNVFAPSLILQEETCRRVDNVVERGLVEAADRGLLLLERPGIEPRRHFGFDSRHVRPAEPRLVAIAADRVIGRRIDGVRAGVPGMEHLPAALTGRCLHGAARAYCTPVDRSEIDIHAEALQ